MNKQEKIIVVLLGLTLMGWLWYSFNEQKNAMEIAREAALAAATNEVQRVDGETNGGGKTQEAQRRVEDNAPHQDGTPHHGDASGSSDGKADRPKSATEAAKSVLPTTSEQVVTLENPQISVSLSSHGAVVKRATLKEYAEKPGVISEENPAVVIDFADSPALGVDGVAGLAPNADFEVAEKGDDFVLFKSLAKVGDKPILTRRITLKGDYQLAVEDEFGVATDGTKPAPTQTAYGLSLGSMTLGASKNDILSIDSWLVRDEKGKSRVEHHGETEPLKSHLVATSGGCSSAPSAAGMPEKSVVDVAGARNWIAVKNRFFVTAIVGLVDNTGFRAVATRDTSAQSYQLKSVSASATFAKPSDKASYTLFIGPKKQSLLWRLGMKDVMEFGMWRWVCYPMVWVLNLFNSWIPNYGVAIILLTILVRLMFWPLTHKSTISMRRMSEIQPKIKDIQKRFKDNPQRLQQEMMTCYRENKVNPMASCLPMLVQIPVFIALFTVLRSAVELRYAPFLWIADLSEPEALGADSWFPWFGGLNILPILMAATMALQSALTPSPSMGDEDKAKQQRMMMMIMMPVMMLFMFYSFPSALSLYWTLSQVVSIAQMWWIRKKYTPPAAKDGVLIPDSVEMPQTRQMRRHG